LQQSKIDFGAKKEARKIEILGGERIDFRVVFYAKFKGRSAANFRKK
jgi:hypothetical protein